MKKLLLIPIILLVSCSQEEKETDSKETTSIQDNSEVSEEPISEEIEKTVIGDAFEITSFTEIPKEIDGCSCAYSFTQKDLDEGRFIYVDDYHMQWGFIGVEGEVIKIDLNDTLDDTYAIQIMIESEERIDSELIQEKGVIEVTNKENQKVEVHYIGECGC